MAGGAWYSRHFTSPDGAGTGFAILELQRTRLVSKGRLVRIFPLQLERSEGQVLRFFAANGFEVSLRTPVLPMRASSSPDRRMRRERDKQLGYLNPV